MKEIGKKVKEGILDINWEEENRPFSILNIYSNWLFPKEKPPSSQTPRLEQTDENKLVGEEEHEKFL